MTERTTIKLRVRDARVSDRTAVLEVTLSAYEQYAAPLGEHWEGHRESILKTLANPAPAAQLVGELDDTLTGTLLLYPAGTVFTAPDGSSLSAPFPELRLLAVPPKSRGRGVATALMREGVGRARAAGAEAVMFHTTALMRAEPLYNRVGDFVRAREFDFQLAPDVRLEAYCLDLRRG